MRSMNTGKVYLVGAGPGDPDLLTLKAYRLIRVADVILHDRLVGAGVLRLAEPDTELIDVGKRAWRQQGHTNSQEEIHDLMIGKVREGRMVVRLQGGGSAGQVKRCWPWPEQEFNLNWYRAFPVLWRPRGWPESR